MTERGDLPRVAILATGGTIAGTGETPGESRYATAVLGVEELLEEIPRVEDLAVLEGEEVARVGSQDMTPAIWLGLAESTRRWLARGDVAGLVVTHGTDTLEETAFFLDLVLGTEVPVVVTGAMRPATGVSADGPRNLLDSVRVVVDPQARNRGVLVVLDESIHTARGVTKTNTANVSTFQSPDLGAAGVIVAGRPVFFRPAASTLGRGARFDVAGAGELPRVDVLHVCAGTAPDIVTATLDSGARGIVVAGVGNGNAPRELLDALAGAVRAGVPVVRSSRTGSGFVARDVEVDDDAYGFVAAGDLNPAKARVLLMLALLSTTETRQLQELFFAPLAGAGEGAGGGARIEAKGPGVG